MLLFTTTLSEAKIKQLCCFIVEMDFINKIKSKFSDPFNIVLLYGDWSNNGMKNTSSVPGIGFKRRLAKVFKLYNVNEFRTSKLCSSCNDEVEGFLKIPPKSNKDLQSFVPLGGQKIYRQASPNDKPNISHELRRCKNVYYRHLKTIFDCF